MGRGRIDDVQGRFLGMPYDWRRPTLHKALRRKAQSEQHSLTLIGA